MGAKIWYYPDPASTVVEIVLGEDISDLQKNGPVIQAASESIAGAIFTFSSYHFAHSIGHMQLITMQWIPLFLLAWLRLLDEPTRRRGFLAALALLDRPVLAAAATVQPATLAMVP